MLVRKSMLLIALAALGAVACENKTDTSKTEPNPGATTTPPEGPVTITNAPVTPPVPVIAAPVNPIAQASNATEVTQFPDQTKISPSTAKIMTVAATVRPAPQSSDQVQVLKQGLEVTEVGKDKDYYLVLFNDSSDATKQKAGWIHKDSLESYTFERNDKGGDKDIQTGPSAAKTAPAASKLTCNAGEVRIQTDHEQCAHSCKDDGDCKKLNGVCDGYGKMVSLSGQMTPAHYCVTSSVPGSTTTTTNAPSNANTPKANTPSGATPSKANTPSTNTH